MPTPNRNSGTAYVSVNGTRIALVGKGSYRCSGTSGESQSGQDGFHGTKRMFLPGRISWTARDGNDLIVGQLNETSDATVVLELANGKTIIGSGMNRVGEPLEVDSEEGTLDVVFEGPSVTEN